MQNIVIPNEKFQTCNAYVWCALCSLHIRIFEATYIIIIIFSLSSKTLGEKLNNVFFH
jgi:hypothetical protein